MSSRKVVTTDFEGIKIAEALDRRICGIFFLLGFFRKSHLINFTFINEINKEKQNIRFILIRYAR